MVGLWRRLDEQLAPDLVRSTTRGQVFDIVAHTVGLHLCWGHRLKKEKYPLNQKFHEMAMTPLHLMLMLSQFTGIVINFPPYGQSRAY